MKKALIAVVITIILIIVVLLCAKNFGGNSYSNGVKQLLTLIENNEGGRATELVMTSFTDEDFKSLVKLIDNENEKIPPLYIMLVSDYIYKNDKDKAIKYFYIGRLRAKEDVFMCADTTARQQIYIYAQAAPKTLDYASQRIFEKNDKEFLAEVLQNALDWDKSHPKRFDPTWACYHGISAFTKSGKPELVSEQEREEIIRNQRKNVEDTIYELKTGDKDLN